MTLDESERTCAACGAVDPEGGLRLGPEGGGAEYEWFCRLTRQCVQRCAENVQRERETQT